MASWYRDGIGKEYFSHDISGFDEVIMSVFQDRLNISNGNLPIKFDEDEKYEGLAYLNLSYNCISEIPENLPCLCPKLISLILNHNQITSVCFLSQSFPHSLKHLCISHNPIKHLNCREMMAKPLPCTNPTVLQESGFTIYTDEVSFCTHRLHINLLNLTVLEMKECWVKDVNFFRPQTVVRHDLDARSGNSQAENIATVGSAVTRTASASNPQSYHEKQLNESKVVCPHLTRLDLSQNRLEEVPESVCEMIELNTLDLSYNAIDRLPAEMGWLQQLCELSLQGLKLVYPPRSVNTCGKTKDIIGYLWSSLHGLVAEFAN